MPTDRLARKISADADSVAPRQSDMMLPVSVMKVMPTATQPMNEMALSSALMLSRRGEARRRAQRKQPRFGRTKDARLRERNRGCGAQNDVAVLLMPPRPGG